MGCSDVASRSVDIQPKLEFLDLLVDLLVAESPVSMLGKLLIL